MRSSIACSSKNWPDVRLPILAICPRKHAKNPIFAVMRYMKLAVFGVFFVLIALEGVAQTKSLMSTGYRVPKMTRNKARVVCPFFHDSQYPYQGIGFKLGDPFALTYKFYANPKWAFALDGGKAASGLYNKYYREIFPEYVEQNFDLVGDETIDYLTHRATQDWLLEAKFMRQWDAEAISKGLQVYAGAGWQWRSTTLKYDYLYTQDPNNPFSETRSGTLVEKRFTYGPVGVLGFEYSYFSIPASAFIEIAWFTDVLVDPGYSRFQGGIGLRYVF